jgi:hypothetical protein
MIQKKTRTDLRPDHEWGANGAGAFYLILNEYF